MLHQLIGGFRDRDPRVRGIPEVAALLSGMAQGWPVAKLGLASRPAAYTRTCVHRDSDFEVLLLNWAAGAASAIHDHGGQHCWMTVLEGRLLVEDFARLDSGQAPGYAHVEPRERRTLGRGEVDTRSGPFDIHRVSAPSDSPAISLHVYAGPLEQFLIYDEVLRRCATALATYDAVLYLAEPLHQ